MIYSTLSTREKTLLKKLITCGLLAVASGATADDLILDGIDLARDSVHLRPTRGADMARVQADFGAPSAQQAAIGEPPITRWDYPGFVVYFEHDVVLHTVAAR